MSTVVETTEATELQRRNQELAALNAIALATSRSLNLEEMLGFSVATILEIVGGEVGCVLLVEAPARRLSVWGQSGLSPELAEQLANITLAGEYWSSAAWLDIAHLWRIGETVKDVVRKAGLASCLLLPVRWRDLALGVLLIGGKEALGQWSIEFLMTVSDQLSVAVRNAQLYGEVQRELAERKRAEEETRRRNEELTALNLTAATVSSSLNLQEVMTRALEKVLAVAGFEVGAIYLLDQQAAALILAVYQGVPEEIADRVRTLPVGTSLAGLAVQSGEPVVVDDLTTDPRLKTTLLNREVIRSFAAIPIKSQEKVQGVLHVASFRYHPFSPEEVRLYTAIAYQIGVAIEKARLYELAQQEIYERRLAEKALRESEERYRHIFEHFPIGIGISSLDGQVINANQAMQAITGYSLEECKKINLASTYERIEDRQALLEAVNRYGSVVDFPARLKRQDGTPYDALLSVSRINLGGKDFYHTICQDVTERQRAAEALRRRAEEMAALQATVLGITAPHDLPTLLQTIVERAARLLDAPGGGMYLCDPQRGEVHCVVSYNTRRDFSGTVLRYGEGAAGTVAQTGEPLIIDDYRAWGGRATVFEEEQPFAAVLSVPMIWQGQVTGVIHVLRDMESRRFAEADLELLLLFANHAAIALENARLYQNVERQLVHISALADLSRAISSTLDLQEILQTAVERTAQVMPGRVATIRLLEGDHLNVGVAVGYREPAAREHPIPIDQRLAQIIEGGQPLILPDLEADPELPPTRRERMRREGVRAYLGVPMMAKGRAIGILSVYRQHVHQWAPEEVELASTIANQVAIAVENARLYTAIAAAKRQLENITDSIADGLYTTDRERRIITFNAAAEAITGWRAAEVLGRFCGDVLRMEDEKGQSLCGSDERCSICWTLQKGYPTFSWGEKRFIVTKSGARISIATIASPLLGEAGQVIGAVAAFWDTSRETKLEQLDRFLSMVAHEILTPLTNIKTAAQLSLRRFDDLDKGTQQEMLELISTQCNRLIDFAGKTLRISYLKTGRLAVERQPFAFLPLIEKAVSLYRIGTPGCRFEVWTQDSHWAIGDEVQTAVVLNVILENAVKYSPPGGTIRIDVAEGEEGVLVSVADQGRGISLEDQKLVFDEFYRGHTNIANGYGLGLYLAKMLLEAQGGKIWLESEIGQGTKVHFALPKA